MGAGLELISYKLCPFVQRAAITLEHKGVPFEMTHIDLAEPPAWFTAISPLGKVPVLRHDQAVLFESAVINEYIDDITGGDLQSNDPLEKARDRAWIEVASEILGADYMMKMAKDAATFERHREELRTHSQRLEAELGEGPWFNGDRFSLVDTAFAPLFTHLFAVPEFNLLDKSETPRLCAWADRLLALDSVRQSTVPEFKPLYLAKLRKNSSYILRSDEIAV